jgi:hypothetical protein
MTVMQLAAMPDMEKLYRVSEGYATGVCLDYMFMGLS